MKLSKRLDAVASLIMKYHTGEVLADIGTDHAYLPCYLVLNNIINKAYACDVVEGPLQKAQESITYYHLEKQVIPLLGSGINPICTKKVDMISICGMGSYLMCEILDEQEEYLQDKLLFLQTNANEDHLRTYLANHNYNIIDEDIIQEGKHIYEMMVVKKGTRVYTKEDIIFGPVLRVKKNDAFLTKWKHQLNTQERILKGLDIHHPHYKEVEEYMNMIKEELYVS